MGRTAPFMVIGYGHAIERDLVEEDVHVEDGVDGYAGFAHVAGDALVVGVVAAMGGEIEGDGETALAGGEVAAIEGVGLFGSGEAGVLSDGPGLHDVHGAVGAAQIGRQAGGVLEMFEALQIFGSVEALDGDVFG